MPLYDYKCTDCGSIREVLQKLSGPSEVLCTSCKIPMRRQVSAPSFRLKGGGWYETDFKSEGKRNIAGDAAPPKNASSADDSPPTKKDAGKKTETAAKPSASSN